MMAIPDVLPGCFSNRSSHVLIDSLSFVVVPAHQGRISGRASYSISQREAVRFSPLTFRLSTFVYDWTGLPFSLISCAPTHWRLD